MNELLLIFKRQKRFFNNEKRKRAKPIKSFDFNKNIEIGLFRIPKNWSFRLCFARNFAKIFMTTEVYFYFLNHLIFNCIDYFFKLKFSSAKPKTGQNSPCNHPKLYIKLKKQHKFKIQRKEKNKI